MRREVTAFLMNEKVTYIDFQGDLWVTFDPWNFSYILITINRKI